MIKTQLVLLFAVLLSCLLSLADAKTDVWRLKNFNKFKSLTLGTGSKLDKTLGIPVHAGWLWVWKGADTKSSSVIVKDPTGKSKDQVLRVEYPSGSRNPEASPIGGIGFRASPLTIKANAKYVTLQYSIYFPKNFKFVKGGKLPGFYGGKGECTGGANANSCFSTRLMWRDGGAGEIYAYLPESKQRSSLCDNKVNICNPDYGYSLGRGLFKFSTGKWTTVKQSIALNTAGKQNGAISLYVNGKKKVHINKLVFRTTKSEKVGGILFHTFFGGSDSTWKTPGRQFSYFKNFELKAFY